MTGLIDARSMGAPLERLDGPAKVAGTALYAFEHPADSPAYLHPLQATIARGQVRSVDTSGAEALDGVLAVLTADNAPTLASTDDAELAILQSPDVGYRGQLIGAVVADTSEVARHAAELVAVTYLEEAHDVELSADRQDLYRPDQVNPAFPTDTFEGDVESAMAVAPLSVDRTYSTAWYHNNPMEPHTTVARWDGEQLTVHASTQGVHLFRQVLATVFGLDEAQIRVVAPHVGGGFGSKGTLHSDAVLAVMAALAVPGRSVKFAVTRQQMFSLVGYRTPTIQRVQLGAGSDGRLSALAVDVVEQTSRIKEFAEQTGVPARVMYRSPARRTTHRLAALDVPVPSWMRAPGECPGMFGPEVAMDELAEACGLDPIELRRRNEPGIDPDSGLPFSSRELIRCLDEGARRFGWAERAERPRARRDGRWLVGVGVASSTYPVNRLPGSVAGIRAEGGGRYRVDIGAVDIGTGARTALSQIAADALGVDMADIDLHLGDTDLPPASVAGGSSGTNCWGSAIVEAAGTFRDKFGAEAREGDEADAALPDNPDIGHYAMHAFGAQFAEVRVDEDTGEIRVPRLLGVFDVGRIINARTARSQLIGGMTMGLSMALHEQSVMDPRFGHVVNHDLAEYHIAANADVSSIEAHWLGVPDPHTNPMGSKGIGEIGIVGTAAAVSNAAYHATGVRVRDLPVTLDKLLVPDSR